MPANPVGAACDENAKSGAPAASDGTAKPRRREKNRSIVQDSRWTRLRAAVLADGRVPKRLHEKDRPSM